MDPDAHTAVEQPNSFFPSLNVRELLAILGIVILADVSIYWGQGYTGIAAFLAGAMAAFCLAKFPPTGAILVNILLCVMIVAMSARLVWYGSQLRAFMGFLWLFAFATASHGVAPYVISVISLLSQSLFAGITALFGTLLQQRHLLRSRPNLSGVPVSVNVLLPLGVCLIFSAVFVLANPDAVTFLGQQWEIVRQWSEWFIQTVLRPTELMFWIAVAWLTAGLLKPILPFPWFHMRAEAVSPVQAPLFTACRNTLVMVNVLFVGYLCIEFITLGTREIPDGFYYAGYAHAGAFWLTVALAMATVVLSLIFSGSMLRDPRLAQLRTLAGLWSLQNLLLALSVYNRLFIYINFNGMTQMRIVGLFGVSLVVVGFLLVVWKISVGRTFAWLVQNQMWAMAIAIWIYSIVPVDAISAGYNVRSLLRGRVAACMQIGVQELDLEGILAILPLLEHPSEEIREGAAARIAEAAIGVRADQDKAGHSWTAHQAIRDYAEQQFQSHAGKWQQYEDAGARRARLERFREFAYRYY